MAICNPYLPQKPLKQALIGEIYDKQINDLTKLGINCIRLPKSNKLDDEISCHADILGFNFGDKIIVSDELLKGELTKLLPECNIGVCKNIFSPYPNDIKLNAAFVGNKIICNKCYVSKEIINFSIENKFEIINTKQGYSKCSICIVNENAVITEDEGIASLLKNYQINVLQIKKGFVSLSDSHHGFIGGASAKVSDKLLYFSGDLSEHPDYNNILKFLKENKVDPIFNSGYKLTDFGGIIPIYEKIHKI